MGQVEGTDSRYVGSLRAASGGHFGNPSLDLSLASFLLLVLLFEAEIQSVRRVQVRAWAPCNPQEVNIFRRRFHRGFDMISWQSGQELAEWRYACTLAPILPALLKGQSDDKVSSHVHGIITSGE
jgi:hypothetical protein